MVIKKEGTTSGQGVSFYDRFRNRIMFPVKNSSGQAIGFSGRIFKEKEGEMGGKYINNPQTVLYDKSRVLFGLDKAKQEIRKNDLCIFVEGQMDVIMSHQAGVKNTVAVSGTALTQEHLNIIKRLTENIAIAFDKDEAGARASKRSIDMALLEGFEVRVVLIPSGKDPADTIKENAEVWREAVKGSKHIIDFYLESVTDSKNIKEVILPYVKLIPDEIKKSSWIKKISEKYGIKEESVWAEMDKIKIELPEQNFYEQTTKVNEPKDRLNFLRDCLIGFISWQKNTEIPELKQDIETIKLKYNLPGTESEISRQTFEAEKHYENAESLVKEFKNLVREFEKEEIKFQLGEITNQIYKMELTEGKDGVSDKDKKFEELLNNFRDLTKKLNEIK
jgi:DNA primase